MATASQEQMQKLHEMIASQLLTALEAKGVERVECPSCQHEFTVRVINTKDMTNAIKFLKDNNIEVMPGTGSTADKLGAAAGKLPFVREPHEQPIAEEEDAPAQPPVKVVGVVLPFQKR